MLQLSRIHERHGLSSSPPIVSLHAPDQQKNNVLSAVCVRKRTYEINPATPIDPPRFLTTILANGECGCRGEDGDQSRLNVSANLERPVQKPAFRFFAINRHK